MTPNAKNCTCGRPKPYRRALHCRACWDGLQEHVKRQLKKDQHSLRLSYTPARGGRA